MKVYVHYEGEGEHTAILNFAEDSKATISDLHEEFLRIYSDKFPGQKTLESGNSMVVDASKKQLPVDALLVKIVSDKQDIYVVRHQDFFKGSKVSCSRPGCNEVFEYGSPQQHQLCMHHKGQPVFHEGLKGWSCCPKRVVSFDDFLNMPGCATAPSHEYVPTALKEKKPVQKEAPEAKLVDTDQTGAEVYSAQNFKLMQQQAQVYQVAKEKAKREGEERRKAQEFEEQQTEDDSPVDITLLKEGMPCLHHACNSRYSGPPSLSDPCSYHPGQVVFHEGAKGWSCCKTRVYDFDEFMVIPGCKTGKHKFVDNRPKPSQEMVECRYDWYQMANTVIVTIYAKNVHKDSSVVKIEPNKISVSLTFNDQKKFVKDLFLSQEVDVSKSKSEILSTKVEIKLQKVNGLSWATLEA